MKFHIFIAVVMFIIWFAMYTFLGLPYLVYIVGCFAIGFFADEVAKFILIKVNNWALS